jgi:hypothetical protein
MTLSDLKTLLATTGIPVSYSSVPLSENTARPYIVYTQPNANNFAADGVVYYSRKHITIRLYADNRDEVSEGKVEQALKDLFYTKSIEFLEDQKIYEITYEIEV